MSRSWRRRSRSRSAASSSSAVAACARRIASQPSPTRRTTISHASYTSLIGSTPSSSSFPIVAIVSTAPKPTVSRAGIVRGGRIA